MSFSQQIPGMTRVLDTLDHGIAIFDKHLHLTYSNPAMKTLVGGELAKQTTLDDLTSVGKLLDIRGKRVPLEKLPVILAFSGKETHDQQYEYIDRMGHRVWLLISCERILDERGNAEYVFTTIRDISRRKSNESKLKFLIAAQKTLSVTPDFRTRLREKARLAVPELADWCAIDVLMDGNIERVAHIHSDMSSQELSESEKMLQSDFDVLTGSHEILRNKKPLFLPLLTDTTLEMLGGDVEQISSLKKIRIKSIMIIPIVVRGKGLGAMTLAYARSGRRYTQIDYEFFQEFCHHLAVIFESSHFLEEIERRDKSKDMFIATLSHELRNPLSPIKSALELVRLQNAEEHLAEELQVIEHNVDHLAGLLDDLLDVTRFTRGIISIQPRMLDLRNALLNATKTIRVLVNEAGITLTVSLPEEQIMIYGDEMRIEQAVMNLLSNAVKFTPRGGTITAKLKVDNGQANVVVRDSGIGIAHKDIGRIFDMFYQAERSKHVSGGLGIGLVLVDNIARLHNGSVRAKSSGIGKGSEFTFSIPCAPVLVPLPVLA